MLNFVSKYLQKSVSKQNKISNKMTEFFPFSPNPVPTAVAGLEPFTLG
jgi:hypothetical protein